MKGNTRDYTYFLTVVRKDGTERNINFGYPKSWFATEESARKGLQNSIKIEEFTGSKVVYWSLSNRSKGRIDEYK